MKAEEIEKEISNKLVRELNLKIDKVIEEGLKLKGFEFDNRLALEDFIKTRCRIEDYQNLKEKRFFVDNEPFLLWDYEQKLDINYNDPFTIKAEAGTFAFL